MQSSSTQTLLPSGHVTTELKSGPVGIYRLALLLTLSLFLSGALILLAGWSPVEDWYVNILNPKAPQNEPMQHPRQLAHSKNQKSVVDLAMLAAV